MFQVTEPEYVTLGGSEIEENAVGISFYACLESEQIPEENVEGLRPTIEIQKQTVDTTIAGAISLNLDNVSWTDQMPQTVRQSMRSVPDESPMKLPPPESHSSIRKKRKLTKK